MPLGCKPDPGPPDPSAATPTTPSARATPTRPAGMHVEILMAGRPPHRSLALVDVVPGDDTHPISITATGYGPEGEVRRTISGTLRNTTSVGAGFEYSLQLDDPDGDPIPPSLVRADAWGPTEAFDQFSDDSAVEAVLRSLLLPVPEDAIGEGAVYRVDVPFGASMPGSGMLVRTTAEVLETFSDGYLLKLDAVLHAASASEPIPVEGKAAGGSPSATRHSDLIVTARQWRHYDRLLPAKAYGQFRYTDRKQSPGSTLIVDWSLDGGAPPPEAP